MPKIKFEATYQGISNQPPWRTQPGQCKRINNFRLSIAEGATTRNGTDLISSNLGVATFYTRDELFFYSFRGDIIIIGNGLVRAINGETGANLPVSVSAAAYTYLDGITKDATDCTSIRNSVIVLNRNKVTATQTSPGFTVSGVVPFFHSLPANATVGQYYQCELADGIVPDGFYRRVDLGGGILGWNRVAAPYQPNAVINASTMPHEMVKASDGSYTFEPIAWTDRRSGDDTTNPAPEWIGENLQTVCYHSNRLFLISKGVIASTSSADLTNVFLNDINVGSDPSNRISLNISNNSAGHPLYSISLGNSLFIACESGQLVFTSGNEQLTNINGQDVQLSGFKMQHIPPAYNGSSIKLIDYNNVIHEYSAINTLIGIAYTGDLNSHALKILHGVSAHTGTAETIPYNMYTFGDTTYVLTNGWIRVHEKKIDAGEILQTGWTTYNFNIDSSVANSVYFMDEFEDKVRMVVKLSNGRLALIHYNQNEEVFPTGWPFSPRLDYRKFITGTYIQNLDITRFDYANPTLDTRVVMPPPGGFGGATQCEELTPVAYDDDTIDVSGKVTGTCCVGNLYTDFITFDQLYPGATTTTPTVSTGTVFYKDTTTFQVVVNRVASGQTLKTYTHRALHAGVDPITSSGVVNGHRTFNILSNGRNVYITVQHKSSVPMTLSAVEFDVRYSDKPAR